MNREIDSKKTLKSATLYSISNIISILVSLVAIPVLTNLLSTEEMGIAVSFNTLKTILAYVVLLSVYSTIDRAIFDFKDKIKEYLSSIYIFSIIVALLFYIIYFIFQPYFNTIFGFDTKMMSLLFLIILLQNAFTITITYWNFKNTYIKNFIVNLFNSPFAQIISLLLVSIMMTNKYMGRIIGVEFFSAISGIVMGIIILKNGGLKCQKAHVKYALTICLPIIPHLISQTILSQCDLLMVKHYCGASKAGIYSLAYSVSTILFTVLCQLMKPWSTWVYRRLNSMEFTAIKQQSKNLITLGFMFTIGLLMINNELIKYFLNKNYYLSVTIAPLLIGAVFFQFIYTFYYDIHYYNKKMKRIMYFSLLVAVLNIILNSILIPRYGYTMAALTTLLCYTLLAFIGCISVKNIIKDDIYNNKYILILGLIIVIYMAMTLIWNNILFKYLIGIIILIIVLMINWKNFLNLLLIFFPRKEVKNEEAK